MNYGEIMVLATPGLIVLATVIATYWMLTNQDKVRAFKLNKPARDPRWKNRKQIVDFVFANITIQATMVITIIGVKLT